MEDYPQEQILKLYESLPKELKEALFSEKTSEVIYAVCKKNNLSDKNLSEIAKYVGYVLLGLLPPNDFKNKIEKELKLEDEVAKEIAQTINRSVFFSIRSILEMLYTPIESGQKKEEIKKENTPKERAEKMPPIKDIYREPID